jgi:hypothetical protein
MSSPDLGMALNRSCFVGIAVTIQFFLVVVGIHPTSPNCWLKQDAQKVLKLTGNRDQEALDWLRRGLSGGWK